MDSFLRGKPFYGREWLFNKLVHYLDYKQQAQIPGVLLVGGPGSGKSAACAEICFPTVVISPQAQLNSRLLAYHFCQFHEAESLTADYFVQNILGQLEESSLVPEFAERWFSIQDSLLTSDPKETFMKILETLSGLRPPADPVFLLVDSLHEGSCRSSSAESVNNNQPQQQSIVDLLGNCHAKFPAWLLLICTARKHWKCVHKLFAGFRKLTLDDTRKSAVVRDVQQYILCRLDSDESLRAQLSPATADPLNLLHIKANGCILYVEKVLDGVCEGYTSLEDISEIPGTLNGLYLWLSQRLFPSKRAWEEELRPLINILLASEHLITISDLMEAAWTRNSKLNSDEFAQRTQIISPVLMENPPYVWVFHNSYAEWLVDVKHCTRRFLCDLADGAGSLAMWMSLKAVEDQADYGPLIGRYLKASGADDNLAKLWIAHCGGLGDDLPVDFDHLALNGSQATLDISEASSSAPTTASSPPSDFPLQKAAREGNLQACEALIDAGCPLNQVDAEGWTPLRAAAWAGHLQIVQLLLRKGAGVDFCDEGQGGRTALRAAAWAGHDDVMQLLLLAGADPNRADDEGRIPLMAAAYMSHADIVARLIHMGCNVNAADNQGRTPLLLACMSSSMTQEDCGRVVQILLASGANPHHADHQGSTALIYAASEGSKSICELLTTHGAEVDHADSLGFNPLLAAASAGSKSCIELLLVKGADRDSIDSEGKTALSVAAAQGHLDVVEWLLDLQLDECHRDNHKWIAIHFAAAAGHADVCAGLARYNPKTLEELDVEGRLPLHLAAIGGHADSVRVLLAHNASLVNQVCLAGKSPLRYALEAKHLEVAKILINHGANVNAVDLDRRSLLYVAVAQKFHGAVQLLVAEGAKPDLVDSECRAPLHVAAYLGDVKLCQLLLDAEANVNQVDVAGRSPLHVAVWEDNTDVVQFLLDKGAAVDHQAPGEGATPLHIAAQCDNEPVVRLLLRYNATPTIRDAYGRTPQMVAQKMGHANLAHLLGETELAKTLSGWSAETQTSGFNSGPQSPAGSPVGTGKKALIISNFFNTQSSSRSNYTTGDESVPEREDFAQILMEKSAVKTAAGLLLDYRPSFGSNAAGPKRPRIRTNPRVKPSPSAQKYHANNNSPMSSSDI